MTLNKYNMSLEHKIREISFSGRMNDWEKEFLNSRQVRTNPSRKQKDIIEKMYQKYVVNNVR